MHKVSNHFIRHEMVEQSKHPLQQSAILPAAKLPRNDDAGDGTFYAQINLAQPAPQPMNVVLDGRISY